uniref:7TM_GPCR_Srx domain-containing protein n=1 Tax=Steinernema glaseri TaxID=37863 RepID=A0A1I7Z6F2_9BILA
MSSKYGFILTRTRVLNTSDSIKIRTGKEDSVDPHFDGPNYHSDRNQRFNEKANFSVMIWIAALVSAVFRYGSLIVILLPGHHHRTLRADMRLEDCPQGLCDLSFLSSSKLSSDLYYLVPFRCP